MCAPHPRPQACGLRGSARVAAGLLALLLGVDAGAVITSLPTGSPRQITMRVGSADATVNSVTFDVNNASLFLNPTPVQGVPGNGIPATSPTGGTEVYLLTRNESGTVKMNLTVSSAAGLSCVAGSGCGSTVIPFNTVSWTSYNHAAPYATLDIQNGTFDGSASQPLALRTLTNTSIAMSNVLIFQYDNATFYPAGQYTGRVVYTATLP